MSLPLLAVLALAATSSADKSSFTLARPTPTELLREMESDRPDLTENPRTVDAGHVQVEMSFLEVTRDHTDGLRTDDTLVLPTNLKLGLTNTIDIELLLGGYETRRFRPGSERSTGFADDTIVRLKINLAGNDDPEAFAIGLIPYVKLPTGTRDLSNDHIEGGLLLPLTMQLPGDFELGLMAELDIVYDESDNDYGVVLGHTASLMHTIGMDELRAYIEYAGFAPIDAGQTYLAIANSGLIYEVNDNLFLDAGVRVGLSDDAEDLTFFVGTTFRF